MLPNLSVNIGERDAIRSFCATSKELYPDRNWHSVQALLETAWARHRMNDSWSWEHVRSDVQKRWED